MPVLNTALGAKWGTVYVKKVYRGNTLIAAEKVNLATNPSFESRSASPGTLRLNLATHSKGLAYVTAQGTNLGWSNSRWFGGGGAGTHTNVTGALDGPLPGVTTYARKTWTTAPTANTGNTGLTTNAWTGFTAGQVYTVSGYIRSSIARTNVGWMAWWADATGVFQRSDFTTGTLAANVWQRFSIVTTCPPTGATYANFILDLNGPEIPPIGCTVDVACLLVEGGNTVGAVTRTNLHQNPSLGRNTTNWGPQAGGGTFTTTREVTMGTTTGALPFGTTTPWFKATCTVTNTGSPVGINANVTSVGTTGKSSVTAGLAYSFAIYAVSTVVSATTMRLEYNWFDAAGASISSGSSTFVQNVADAWQRLTATNIVAPAGSAYVSLAVRHSVAVGAFPVGGYIGATCAEVQQSTTLVAYFDGYNNASAASNEFAWTGTPFNSTSVWRNQPTGYVFDYYDGSVRWPLRTNWCVNPNFEITGTPNWTTVGNIQSIGRDTAWSFSGSNSMKVTTTAGTSTSTSGDLRYNTGSATAFPQGMRPGGTYTVSAYINTPVALTGLSTTASSRQKRILYFYSTNGVAFTEAFGPQGHNFTGVQRLSHTFTIPTNATGVVIGIGCAGSGTDQSYVTYVDGVLFEESPTLNAYFDGTNKPEVRRNYCANPSMDTSYATGWGSFWSPLRSVDFTEHYRGVGSQKVANTQAQFDAGRAQTGVSMTGIPFPQVVGEIRRATVVIKGTQGIKFRIGYKYNAGITQRAFQAPVATGDWQVIDIDPYAAVSADMATTLGVEILMESVAGGVLPADAVFWVDSAVYEIFPPGTTVFPERTYFDGSNPTPGNLGVWTGSANVSQSYIVNNGIDVAWGVSANASASYSYDPQISAGWTGTADATTSTVRSYSIPTVTAYFGTYGILWYTGVDKAPGSTGNYACAFIRTQTQGATGLIMTPTLPAIPDGKYFGITFKAKAATGIGWSAGVRATSGSSMIGGLAISTTGDGQWHTYLCYGQQLNGTPGQQAIGLHVINGSTINGNVLYVDEVAMFITDTVPTLNYRDGRSPGWIWTGTVDGSTSSGWN